MNFLKILKLCILYFLILVNFQAPSYAEDVESGEEIADGCPNANCECINDSSRGTKPVIEEGSESGSSSSDTESR